MGPPPRPNPMNTFYWIVIQSKQLAVHPEFNPTHHLPTITCPFSFTLPCTPQFWFSSQDYINEPASDKSEPAKQQHLWAMAGSITYNQKPSPIVIGSKEIGISTLLTQKSGINLMQNCDLPPPLKVFTGNDMAVVFQSNKRISSMTTQKEENMYGASGLSNEKLELLKALRLSQTRARVAETRAAVLREERDAISNALLHESSRLFVYRQWVKLLELQVSTLQRQHQEPICGVTIKKEDDNDGGGSMVWIVALALCFSIASLGFEFGGPTLELNLFSFS